MKIWWARFEWHTLTAVSSANRLTTNHRANPAFPRMRSQISVWMAPRLKSRTRSWISDQTVITKASKSLIKYWQKTAAHNKCNWLIWRRQVLQTFLAWIRRILCEAPRRDPCHTGRQTLWGPCSPISCRDERARLPPLLYHYAQILPQTVFRLLKHSFPRCKISKVIHSFQEVLAIRWILPQKFWELTSLKACLQVGYSGYDPSQSSPRPTSQSQLCDRNQ